MPAGRTERGFAKGVQAHRQAGAAGVARVNRATRNYPHLDASAPTRTRARSARAQTQAAAARESQRVTSALSRVKQSYRSPRIANLSSYNTDEAAALVKHVGGSRREAADLSTKVLGESGGNPKAIGHDPGGTIGRGLWQLTTGVGNDDLIAKHGGPNAMLKPVPNAKAALELYRGGGLANWYAPSSPPGNPDKVNPARPRRKDVRVLHRAGVPIPRPTKGAKAPHKSSAAKRYTNPFPSKAWQQSRTDQGVDFAPKTANAPIRAIGDATFVGKGEGPAWASGGGGGTGDGLLYKLHNAKGLPSSYIFVYEGVRADPHLKPGQTIKRGQIIGQGIQGGSIESGYADSSGTPISHSTYTEGMVTRGGTQFQNLLAKLPGSSATKGNIGSFVSSGGGGASGVAGFTSATGIPAKQAKNMTPSQRRRALARAIAHVTSGYGSPSSSAPSTGTGSLGSKYGHPAV